MTSDPVPTSFPGQRLGLPSAGSGAAAGWGRRVVALVIDWLASMLAAAAFIGAGAWTGQGSQGWLPLVVFLFEAWILTTLLGGSAGQLALRLVVRRTSGAPLGVIRALLRTVLICLVIPPVIYNRDQQGLHDLAVDSVVLRR